MSRHVQAEGNETINGVKTFGSFPETPSSAPTTDYQAANKKYVDDTHFNNVLAVGTNQKYTTIASALADFVEGDIIYLSPEQFNEDITISTDSVKILGMSRELSRIKSIVVNGSNAQLKNLSIIETATFTSQETWDWFSNGILVEDVDFLGALNIGTPTTVLQESIRMYNCAMLGNAQDLIINCYNGNNVFYDFRMQHSLLGSENNIIIYGGRLEFERGKGMFINNLQYMTAGTYSLVTFSHQYPMAIKQIITVISTEFHILTIENSRFDLGLSSGGSDFTFSGKFELDILQSSVAIWDDIIFNSSAPSRLNQFMHRGYSSTTTISGTGLAHLYIYNSSFKCASPGGLGGDAGNIWSAFVDD